MCLLQAKYIAQCMDEIKAELRQENFAVKANAVAKLTYVSIISLFMYITSRLLQSTSGSGAID